MKKAILKAKDIPPGKVRVVIRHQLYVQAPDTGLVIAGPRLLKGDTATVGCPEINFASDTPEDAEKQRAKLELYLNKMAEQK